MFYHNRITNIKKKDLVLEIGPGGTPYHRADEFLDINPSSFANKLEASMQRGSAPKLSTDKKVTYYDGVHFPYKDNSFDYVIASHVIEHVKDIPNFINEVMRIGKRGYIEFPTILYDYLYNIPVHLSFIHFDKESNTLYYINKSDTHIDDFYPLQAFLLDSLGKGYSTIVDNSQYAMFEGFEWESSQELKIVQAKTIKDVLPDLKKIRQIEPIVKVVVEKEYINVNKELQDYTKNELLTEIARRSKKAFKKKVNAVRSINIPTIKQYGQQLRYSELSSQFANNLTKLESLGKERFVMPFWSGVNDKVKAAFLPKPPADFLGIRAIRDTMFVEGDKMWLETQLSYIKEKLVDYKSLIKEDSFGSPKLLPKPYDFTSHNTIHHLYHLAYFLDIAKTNGDDIKVVSEWGGGYGNFAKLWYRKFPKSTYIIIDTALFCSIQQLYLGSIFGKDKIHTITSKKNSIKTGCINLVPLAMLDYIDIRSDLFVSTWGLSESAKEAQDYVVKNKWFKSKHLLIGFQDSYNDLPYASRLGDLAKKDGAKIIDIPFIPNNHYAIK